VRGGAIRDADSISDRGVKHGYVAFCDAVCSIALSTAAALFATMEPFAAAAPGGGVAREPRRERAPRAEVRAPAGPDDRSSEGGAGRAGTPLRARARPGSIRRAGACRTARGCGGRKRPWAPSGPAGAVPKVRVGGAWRWSSGAWCWSSGAGGRSSACRLKPGASGQARRSLPFPILCS
jgi:hypothetical protein